MAQCVSLVFALLLWRGPSLAAAIPEDASKAVILTYHRIGEDHLPDQSLTLEQFETHIEELSNGAYTVLPLGNIVNALTEGRPLPPRTLGITLEGAYQSAITHAAPLLLKHKLPFTVFYASDAPDNEAPAHASWRDLKALHKNPLVSIGALPATYDHLAHQTRIDALSSINKARQRYREEFQSEAAFFSYPYGEYSLSLKNTVEQQGFKAAFGLHSGAAYHGGDMLTLPRFSMTDGYGDLERLRLVTNALPLPAQDIEPTDTVLTDEPFFTGFTLPGALRNEAKNLSCFISGQTAPSVEILGTRVEIRPAARLQDQTRIRLNCTMPGPVSKDDDVRWRWFGLLYHRTEKNEEEEEAPKPRPQDEPLPLQE